jgi:hypothetical protein
MEYEDFLPLVDSVWNQSFSMEMLPREFHQSSKILRGSLKKRAKEHQNLRGSIEDIREWQGPNYYRGI